MLFRTLIAILSAAIFFSQALIGTAQVTTGTILGTARDESGAVLPNASIVAKNVGTGIARTVATGAGGEYRITQLPPGSYEVQAQLEGFQTEVRTGITMTVGREAVLDMTLRVGAVSERVSVTAEAPLIETTNSSVASLVDENSIELLPLNGRDLTQLATLQPGVLLASTTSTSTTAGPGKKISISGSRPNQSTYLLDGIDVMNNTGKGVAGASGEFLGLDAVREFSVLTSNYSAEFGRAAGGVINVVSKSGTNVYHGTLFEYLRNDNLDARNFFDDEKPNFRRNQFGASAGGRIRRDKTFFFAAYEGLREGLGLTSIAFVPTQEAKRGLLPNNVTVAVDPLIQPVLGLFPLPNRGINTDGTGVFASDAQQTTNESYVTGKIDYYLSDSDSLFGRYTIDDGERELPFFGSNLPGYGLPLRVRGQYFTLQETKLLTSNFVNIARAALNRTRYSGSREFDVPALKFYAGRPVGNVTTTGLAGIGGGNQQPFDHPITIVDFSDDVNWSRGSHAIKAGFIGRRYLWGFQRDFRLNGTFNFTTLSNLLRNAPQSFTGVVPGSNDTRRHYRQSMFGFYFQDDLKVRPGFTLNLGLRYEFISNPTEATGPRLAYIPRNWDETDSPNGILTDRVFEKNPSLRNLSPRFGFAWDVMRDGKTSLRGGWALLHDQIYPLYYDNQRVPPLVLTADIRTADLKYPNAFGSGPVALASLSPVATDYFNTNTPSVMQFNVSVQREIAASTVLTAAYIGSRSYHLAVANDVNTRVPDFLPNGRIFFPAGRPFRNPNWTRTSILEWTGRAFYNSLQVSANKRLSNGFQIGGNYTYARNVDDGSGTIGGDFANSTRQRQNPYDRLGDRGLASMHIAHSASLSYVVDLPFGSGRLIGGGVSGVAGKILEGWQVQGIVSGNSGPPFTATVGTLDRSRSGNLADRPDLLPGASNNPVLGGPDKYFDTSAFTLAEPGYFGNLGRNTLIGPGRLSMDFSLLKNTSLREGVDLQFRAELFNIINRANFKTPDGPITADSGVVLTETSTSARQVQFGLKILF